MGGNSSQWTDTIITMRHTGQKVRGAVGGSVNLFNWELQSVNNRCDLGGYSEREDGWEWGFRVATLPDPPLVTR
jgi:hypothetical protein